MIIPTINKIFTAIMIILGLYMNAKFLWMCIYQFKYGSDYGGRYIQGLITKEEKEELKKGFKWANIIKRELR